MGPTPNSVKRSRYAKVNERRRKLRWNNRSTAQLNRRRSERRADLDAAWTTERRGKRTRHGLVNTGYMASLMAEREEVLREAREVAAQRQREALPPELVPVSESYDGRNQPYVRSAPAASYATRADGTSRSPRVRGDISPTSPKPRPRSVTETVTEG
jgi:hypothetical protein